ncbi:MAG: hypothetical protein J6R60_04750, partial [Clostridia bacterium]|nr:hypothetical protein [Clostridia bacterium]
MKTFKKILCIAIALIMIIGLVGCAPTMEPSPTHTKEIPTQEAQPTTTEKPEAPETEESYVFLVYNSEGGSPVKANGFGGVWEYGLYTSGTHDVLDSAKKNFKNPITQELFEYKNSDCDYKDETKTEYGSHYSVFDKYIKDGVLLEV